MTSEYETEGNFTLSSADLSLTTLPLDHHDIKEEESSLKHYTLGYLFFFFFFFWLHSQRVEVPGPGNESAPWQ